MTPQACQREFFFFVTEEEEEDYNDCEDHNDDGVHNVQGDQRDFLLELSAERPEIQVD